MEGPKLENLKISTHHSCVTAETLLSQFRKCFVDAILPVKSFSISHTESNKLLSNAETLLSLLKIPWFMAFCIIKVQKSVFKLAVWKSELVQPCLTLIFCKDSREGSSQCHVGSNFILLFFWKCKLEHFKPNFINLVPGVFEIRYIQLMQ